MSAVRVLPFPAARPAADAVESRASANDGRPAPYTVRRYAAPVGHALLVGFDGAGAPLIEVRVPYDLATADVAEWVRDWCQAHGAPALRLEGP